MVNSEARKSNRLIDEKSPYLLQHAYNPVDWYTWGEDAFARAKAEDKPVFLSIGYSTCHWCHVMERESFEDPDVAELLNRNFISIKVDREERPDLDHIYMTACQALTGQGGWPLTVFLTPEKKPFFAGTYFPKQSRHGIAGLLELLPNLSSLWKREREKVNQAGDELFRAIREQGQAGAAAALPGMETLKTAFMRLQNSFDQRYGGFGSAPKFPIPHELMFLLRYWKRSGKTEALDMVTHTLKAMAAGGICDQLGYGFHRYSTDAAWLVPHFEKMLYDQALLALAYLEVCQAARDPDLAAAARQIFEYVQRDLTSPEGAFYAAEDADSEGVEGLFYLWTRAEIMDLLGEKRGRIVADYYNVTAAGNFEKGKSILHVPAEKKEFAADRGIDLTELNEILAESREILLQTRSRRERPFRDDKIITGWNGLMIAALARGAAVLSAPLYAVAAREAALFIRDKMVDYELGLRRRYREDEAAYPAFLDDYAYLVWGLIELYEATFQAEWLRWAVSLTSEMLTLFDGKDGALRYAPVGQEEALPAFQDAYDGAVPSGNSVAALNLLRLGRMTGRGEWEERGEAIVGSFSEAVRLSPTSFTMMLSAVDSLQGPTMEVVLAGATGAGQVDRMAAVVREHFNPNVVVLFHPTGVERKEIESVAPFVEPMTAPDGQTIAFLCRNRSCQAPVNSVGALKELLADAGLASAAKA